MVLLVGCNDDDFHDDNGNADDGDYQKGEKVIKSTCDFKLAFSYAKGPV